MGSETVIEEAWAEAEETAEQRAKRREQGAKTRERQEADYRGEFADAIRRFLNFAPEHSELASQIASEAAARAAAVGSGRVGRTQTLSLDERAALAARALIRHRYTTYEDDLFDASMEDPWDEKFCIEKSKPRLSEQSMTFSTTIGERSRIRPTTSDWRTGPRS